MDRSISVNEHQTSIETFDNITRQVRFIIDEDALRQDGLIHSYRGGDHGWRELEQALIVKAQEIVEEDPCGMEWEYESSEFDEYYRVYRVIFVGI